ncbi:hypothetical protein PTSG_04764 [Salpingoeca rosetta]|nr:uncharacterized protein PTSG_04764 [Salpingoeca rosetta]EGD73051.1 hypothetical protein PTSG_04764 [Salpingoeca rosetta]|eukprot:XP_004994082.1 hypothetical protein PTSG_04764 [Salpingoeca rosetta]
MTMRASGFSAAIVAAAVAVAVVVAVACGSSAAAAPVSARVNTAALLHHAQGVHVAASDYPPPFSRSLKKGDSGNDVGIYQFLVFRALNLTFPINNKFDTATVDATRTLQRNNKLEVTGEMNLGTAKFVMNKLTRDHYVDDGKTAESQGYKYKVVIDVHRNRSIESIGKLYAGNGTLLFTFPARLHGWDACDCEKPWPDFNNSDDGLTSFASDGNTPTGLMEFDLNSPEPVPRLYGPYPVNRAVMGLKGNAKFLIPNVRNGILMHTGTVPP